MDWYAIFVETGREEEVQKYIDILFPKQDIRTLVPKRKLIERRQGKTYEKIRTLIPGYVLTQVSMDYDLYYRLKEIPNVYRILRGDIDPMPIQEEEMGIILSLTGQGEIIELSEVYREGNEIRVLSGPLKGLEGIIEKFDHRKKRVKVCIEFLGEYKRVDLGANLVIPKGSGEINHLH